MADEYTPDTDHVRDIYVQGRSLLSFYSEGRLAEDVRNGAAFDRWLAQHDDEVAARELHKAARIVRSIWTGNTNLPDLDDEEVAYSFDVWLEKLAAYYDAPSVTAESATADGRN
jgi:hypothetical protein